MSLAALLLIFVMFCANVTIPEVIAASSDGYTVRLFEDFEKSTAGSDYVNHIDNTGIDYFGPDSEIFTEGSVGSITGNRSLRLFNCDLRWQGMNIEDLSFRTGFSVKVGRNFSNEMRFIISTQDSATSAESAGGTLLIIRNGRGGNTFLYGADNTQLFELKKDTVYRISVEITRGKNECRLSVNGESAGHAFKFRSAVYCITGMRVFIPKKETAPEPTASPATPDTSRDPSEATLVSSAGPESTAYQTATPYIDASTNIAGGSPSLAPEATEAPSADIGNSEMVVPSDDNTLLIDDLFISTKGREYPQTYSIQAPGKLPELEVNSDLPSKRVRVYVNAKEIDMSKAYVTDNTVYISAEQFLKGISMDYSYDKNERMLRISDNKVSVAARVPGNDITVNGQTVTLAYPVRTIDDVIMISPNFINEVFNAKVWWDREARMLVVTSGSQKSDDILRLVGDRLYMNGEPYYEISFNKYDLFTQLWAAYSNDPNYPSAEYRDAAAEAALKQLHDNGFKSVRVFCCADVPDLMYDAVVKGKYYETMDKMFDLCDKYDIKVVVCLGLISDNFVVKQKVDGYGLVNKSESRLDLVAYAESESRTVLAQYIKEFVDRYRSRKTVLMYEITNEGNLDADVGNTTRNVTFSLGQLADFYKFCADTIRSVDAQRVVTGGDSVLRNAQYNLFAGTMAGRSTDDWTTDTPEERLYALTLLNYGIDVISAHTYKLGSSDSGIFYESNGKRDYYGFEWLMEEAAKLGKPLYNGESQVLISAAGNDYAKDASEYLDALIEAGVQITHWWTFRSDKAGSDDGSGWSNDSGEIFEVIKEANRKLNAKYVVNGVGAENTFSAGWKEEDEIIDPEKIISGVQASKETSSFEAIKWTLIMALSLTVICGGIVFLFRRRMKKGN